MRIWKALIVVLKSHGQGCNCLGKDNRLKGEETSTVPQKTPVLHVQKEENELAKENKKGEN